MKICITNRHLCNEDFFETVKNACKTANMIVLREKDLDDAEYKIYAEKIKKICFEENTIFCINKYIKIAKEIGCDALQLSYNDFLELDEKFCQTGVSVHSIEEAVNACNLGADFLIAGHIFETDCKKGVTPRGTKFLKKICNSVNIPVYAIGGINSSNENKAYENGASGVCMMSAFMKF